MQKINDEIYNAARAEQDKGNYEKAFELYSEGVERGDVRCNYGVALFYNYGYFVKKDEAKAAEIFALAFPSIKELAEQNDPISCCIIGFYYFNGFYVLQDKAAAVRWYRKAARKGNIYAQYCLGNAYFDGDGVQQDPSEAIKLYKNSAKRGCVFAQYNLACCYADGEGVKKDNVEAVKWYKKAAEQGYAEAQYNLACCYADGEGVKVDKTEAVEWCKKAAERGLSEAQFNLGNCYRNGDGVNEDRVEAINWYMRAAEQGCVDAQFVLGNCYRLGDMVKEDKFEAMKWYRKAAEQGLPKAQYNLALCYYYGDGIKEDKAESVKWLKKAAEQKIPEAQDTLGDCYSKGDGIAEDKTEAVKWYKKAAEQGLATAQLNLGYCYGNGVGIKEDKVEAAKLYEKAAEQGDPFAQCVIGACYGDGVGVEKNKFKSVRWYKEAAGQGDPIAQCMLGMCYFDGEGVLKSSFRAKTLFESVSKSNNWKALFMLAKLYKERNALYECSNDMITLYLRVLKMENVQPLFGELYVDLAQMYDNRYPQYKGIYKDNCKAKEYYEKAIENGAECKSDLKTLEVLMYIEDSEANRMGEFVKEISQKNISLTSLYSVVEERLKREFISVWNRLQSETKECLITGCISYVALISTGEENYKNMDFSSAILPMVKACEIEFGRIFFDKFLEYLKKNNIPPTEFDPDKQKFVERDKRENGGVLNYVSLDKTGVFTLGGIDKYAGIKGPMSESIMYGETLTFCKNGMEVGRDAAYGGIKIAITVNKHVLAFMNEVFTEDAFPGDDREEQIKKYLYSWSRKVCDMAFQLRNPSAHTCVMSFWKALYCANMVIMVDRILFDFVSKLKPEYTEISMFGIKV